MQQNMRHDVPNGLRGVLPVLPIPIEQMSEVGRTAYEAFRQAEQVKHQATKEAAEAAAAAEAQAKARAEAERKVQALAVSQASTPDFKTMQAHAAQENARRVAAVALEARELEVANKLLVGVSAEWLQKQHGAAFVLRAQQRSMTMKPTPQQAFTRARNRANEAQRELGKALAANGVGRQHSVQDYTLVICTQLNLQLQGNNPPATEVLHTAFPHDSAKAISIGNSRRMSRVKKAYQSDQVKHHPIQKSTQALHGARVMQQRCSTKQFRQSLGLTQTLFHFYSEITGLKAGQVELRARVGTLERQMSSTKCRESLDDAGATTSIEKVLMLRTQGMNATEIANALGMKPSAVRMRLKRAKEAGIG